MNVRRRVRVLIDYWEAYQVELHGRYSLDRLYGVINYARHSRRYETFAVLLLTPLPGLMALVVMDVLPLNPPKLGVMDQTFGLYFRALVTPWSVAFMATMQMHQGTPRLPLSAMRLWAISVLVSLVCFAQFFVFGLSIGYPTPFVVQLLVPSWLITLTSLLWISWKHTLRRDSEARTSLLQYSTVLVTQVVIITLYTAVSTVFRQLPGNFQTILSLCLPLVKIFWKNWMSKGLYHLEDLAPTTIVLSIDVFHAMFTSSTTQQSSTFGSTVAVMFIDIGQCCVAYSDMQKLLTRAHQLAQTCQSVDSNEIDTGSSWQSNVKLKLSVIDYALHVLETCPSVREHPDVCKPRHLRPLMQRRTKLNAIDVQTPRGGPIARVVVSTNMPLPNVAPVATEGPSLSIMMATQPNKQEQDQRECVTSVLKLLHVVEFCVLIEFIEVVVAAIFTLYMLVLTYLPNRQYYNFLASLSQEEMAMMVTRLTVYTLYELLSFIVLCLVVDWRLRGISSFQLLAFVLRKHARVVQTMLVMWVFFVVQLNFVHFGTDYTFKFEWLRKKHG